MTPAEGIHIQSRLTAIEIILIALAKTIGRTEVQPQVAGAKEAVKVLLLNSTHSDDYAKELESSVMSQIERLELAIWGEAINMSHEQEQKNAFGTFRKLD